jgi:M6 family metalloprotease-like protein
MRVRTLLILLVVLGLAAPLAVDRSTPTATGRSFSAVPLRQAAADALRAQGKPLKFPFPNAINQGPKFNPVGDLIPALATAPEQKVLVILVQFTDMPPGGPEERLDPGTYFDDMLFGTVYDPPEYASYSGHPTDRTLRNFYEAVSYGAVDVVTANLPSKTGWAQAGHPYSYYCKWDGVHDNGFGPYPNNAQGLVVDAVKAVDKKVDFSKYAVDGVVPNVFVVHAGTGAEWNGDPNIIWSHSWSLDWVVGGRGLMTDDRVVVNNYAMMPEVGGDTTDFTGYQSGPYPPTVGVYAHEYGHVLGLPDQYDYGYESSGTGIYSLMAGGSWNQWPVDVIFAGNSPSFLDAWSRYRLGFVHPIEVWDTRTITLRPAETDPTVYKMIVPFSGGREYFLLENRQQIGFDKGLNVYGKGGETVRGLAIYHIDDTVLTRNYWRPNEAENWKEFRSEGAKAAWTGEAHYGISIIQADDRWDLEHGIFGYFRSDLYPGTYQVTSFTSYTHPNSSSYYFWGGSDPKFGYSDVTITNIEEKTGVITARLGYVPWRPSGK